jgi:succinoglycan biosynthesis transport protein ExoP
MSINQFFLVIWAHRRLIAITTVVMLLIALVVVLVVPPKYRAETRIMLDVIKPDSVTGQVMASPMLRAYAATQTELIKDYGVANWVVDHVGWASDPKVLDDYRKRKSGDDRDFARWAAQRIIDNAQAKVIEGSNIISITYAANRPDEARRIADALRQAYIVTTLENRRDGARRDADWYDDQAQKAKVALTEAEANKSAFERSNGVLLQDDKTDIDTARLAALATQAGSPILAPAMATSSAAGLQIAQLDAEIAQQSKVLGPNHPQLLEMRRRRELLQAEADREQSAAKAVNNMTASAANVGAGLLEAQKSKVMGQREKVEQLMLLQDNVNLRRDQYTKTAAHAAELRQEAGVAETGITPLGSAVAPQDPVFPNIPLIMAGAFVGGIGLGIVISLLMEFFGRRVRSSEDLEVAIGAPVLAIIRTAPPPARRKERTPRPSRRPSAPARKKVA